MHSYWHQYLCEFVLYHQLDDEGGDFDVEGYVVDGGALL